MRVAIDYGRQQLSLDVADDVLVEGRVAVPPAALADPGAAVRDALEHPHDFPALRRALTPDDHVAVVVDERLPQVGALLVPLLEHVVAAGVRPDAVTLLGPPHARQDWVEALPESLQEVRTEIHDPTDRKRLSYLATMRRGRRLYLNRTAVDADQTVVLSGRRFDALHGHGGAAGALFPALSDEATRAEAGTLFS